jgi:hypothetical protein
MSDARKSLLAAATLFIALSALVWMAGCGPNAKDKAVLHSAETIASGWRTLGKVDVQRQDQIRTLIVANPAAARETLRKHEALYKVFEKALDGATALIERIDREGLGAALVGELARATEDVAKAAAAYEKGAP